MTDINRRQFIGTSAAALAAASTGGIAMSQPSKRPNILFMMGDQHRGDTIGADGHPCVQTPHLDRIANEGVLFSAAYSSTPSCTPARAGILSGLKPWNHGQLGYGRVADAYPHEFPTMLNESGYHTRCIGKNHFHPQRHPHGYGDVFVDESGRAESDVFVSDYRQWFATVAPDRNPDETGIGWNDHRAKAYALPEELHPTRWTGNEAVRFIDEHEGDEPWLLKVSFARPHSPYDPPARLMDMYADADIPPAAIGDWAEQNAMRGAKHDNSLARGDLGPNQPIVSRQGYYGSVTFIDEQIGRIVAALEARGDLDNTLIVYTADHGDMLGDHHLWRKTYGYQGSARIPMLVRWPTTLAPDAERGRTLPNPVELRDLAPTFLHAGGAEYDPEWFDGRSMIEAINGASDWREFIDLEHSRCYWKENQWTGLTDGRWKYLYYAPTGRQELFDMESDPCECRNLADDPAHAADTKLWRQRMVDELAERGEPFVIDGDLGIREPAMLWSPNYPKKQEA